MRNLASHLNSYLTKTVKFGSETWMKSYVISKAKWFSIDRLSRFSFIFNRRSKKEACRHLFSFFCLSLSLSLSLFLNQLFLHQSFLFLSLSLSHALHVSCWCNGKLAQSKSMLKPKRRKLDAQSTASTSAAVFPPTDVYESPFPSLIHHERQIQKNCFFRPHFVHLPSLQILSRNKILFDKKINLVFEWNSAPWTKKRKVAQQERPIGEFLRLHFSFSLTHSLPHTLDEKSNRTEGWTLELGSERERHGMRV